MGLKVYPQFNIRFLNIKGGCLFVQHHDAHPQAPATPFDVMFVICWEVLSTCQQQHFR
jgi:hypothetical protein